MEKNILPEDFDGVFRFTNFTDSEFKAKWNNVVYTFPPLKTVPLIIPNATPEEVQNIRKKFAKELALREFGKSSAFQTLNNVAPGGIPALYTDSDLTPFVQRCLEPLPIGQAVAKKDKKVLDESVLRKDEEGNPVSRILDGKKSLIQEAGSGLADM